MLDYMIKRTVITVINVVLFMAFFFLVFSCAHLEKYTRLPFVEYFPMALEELRAYVTNIIQSNNWGLSHEGTSVWEFVGERVPLTLLINSIAFAIYFVGGLVIGLLCALYEHSIFDWLVTIIISILSSIPIQVMTLFLIGIFAWVWRIATVVYLPDNGVVFSNLFIPITAISIIPLANIIRMFRSELIESKHEKYIQLARTKGMSKRKALVRHSIRGSLVPVINELPNIFIFALAGSFVVEVIYRVPGVSMLMFSIFVSLSPIGTWYVFITKEAAIVVIAFYIVLSFGFNLIVDIIMPLLDPRIKVVKVQKNSSRLR